MFIVEWTSVRARIFSACRASHSVSTSGVLEQNPECIGFDTNQSFFRCGRSISPSLLAEYPRQISD
jgi:hypothetical protein